jgi:hypothetical protein
MKRLKNIRNLLIALLLLSGYTTMAQSITSANSKTQNDSKMKTYLIEREIPGLGKSTPAELKSISQASCKVLKEMGPQIQWLHSYVTGDKLFCIYKAESVELIKEHAKRGGFPANNIIEISSAISPATAE